MTNPETGYEKAHRQVEQIFRQFFPARGMVTREGQIRLCHMMLDALFGLDVALCDAGVGLGKTYAYLVACVLWQLQRPRQMQRPVVISTAIHTFGAKDGNWIEPGGRRWMVLPGYDEEVWNG